MYLLTTLLLMATSAMSFQAVAFMLFNNTTDIKNTWLGKTAEYIRKWLPKK